MKMSRIESGMRLALAFYEAFNGQDVEGMAGMISDDCLVEAGSPAPDGRIITGREAITQYWLDMFHEEAALRLDIEDLFGLGQRVIAQYRRQWTDADGTAHQLRGVDILRVQSNTICEILTYTKGLYKMLDY